MKPTLQLAAGLTLCLLALSAPRAQEDDATTAEAQAAVETAESIVEQSPGNPQQPPAVVGDVERGNVLAFTCSGCHGVAGYRNAYPHYHVPLIGGQNEAYLAAALIEYRDGNRRHPTMRAQAESFSDQDIADLAAYLSTLGGGAR
ncbi:c-type cytochrome [Coralloluteibacterium thermophilus]|uniref:C-type cytochrome n=1 Tax=Coralloluteibacterium thermophilum TaxID=2707049 RepID=A0ABV9NJM1_9GAMM